MPVNEGRPREGPVRCPGSCPPSPPPPPGRRGGGAAPSPAVPVRSELRHPAALRQLRARGWPCSLPVSSPARRGAAATALLGAPRGRGSLTAPGVSWGWLPCSHPRPGLAAVAVFKLCFAPWLLRCHPPERAEPATGAQRGQLACRSRGVFVRIIAEPSGRAVLSVGDLVVLRGDLLVLDSV